MSNTTYIACPDCGKRINIEDVLSHDIEIRLQAEYVGKLDEVRKLAANNAIAATRSETETQLKALLLENEQRKAETLRLKQREVELLDTQRKLKEKEEEMDLIVQKRVLEERVAIEASVKQAATERFELEKRELEKKLSDQLALVEEMKRKATQGSQQLAGETQELAIEEWLRATFPYDDIDEIKKGALGGDCLQTVHEPHQAGCGTIYYESKRTKNFEPRWIEKFREDMRNKNADVGVLVTETMPKDMPRFGKINGVWVCTYVEFKALCVVLRDLVVQVAVATASQENRGEKMVMLYDYLTGNEFRMQIGAIVEGFTAMQEDLNAERRAMERLWKQREKQIEKVLHATSNMHGAVKGIAGSAIQPVRALELPDGDRLQ